jgi:16S rRNA (uracil1498-N3)-methyltransferase
MQSPPDRQPDSQPAHKPTRKPAIQHHVWYPDLSAHKPNDSFDLIGPEAHHAVRVKRVSKDHRIGLLDGCGTTASASVRALSGPKSKPIMHLVLEEIQTHPPTNPVTEIFAALPKGDRLDRMVDQLSQLGVSTFRPLLCDRSQRKPETIRQDKLQRIAIESMKQCIRPWVLKIDDPITFNDALTDPDIVIADASGSSDFQQSNPSRVVVLIGPEGGWSNGERECIQKPQNQKTQTHTSNAQSSDSLSPSPLPTAKFGPHVLRIESAAAAASAIVQANHHQLQRNPS